MWRGLLVCTDSAYLEGQDNDVVFLEPAGECDEELSDGSTAEFIEPPLQVSPSI